MRIDEFTKTSDIDEAPVGMLKKAGQAVGAKVLNKIGMKGKAGNLASKADLSDTANNLYNEFRKYLGTQQKDINTATGEDLDGFLKSKGAVVPGIPSGVINKQQINQAVMQASKDALAKKQGVQKSAPQQGTAPAQAQTPAATPKVKISPELMQKIKSLNPQQKKELARIL